MELFETYMKGYDEANKPFLLANKKETVKKVNSLNPKPKGDIELKNIHYRFSDKRYVGKKQINNKIIYVYAKTQKECADKLKERINNILTFGHKPPTSNKYLLKDLYMQWFFQEKEPFISSGTKRDILAVYNDIAEFHNLSIKKINKNILTNFFSKKPDNRTKEKTRLYLNACLKFYYNEGLISINPCANVKVKKSYNRKTAFTYEQQLQILEAIKNKSIYPVIMIYLITGLRKNELNFTSIEKDIDFDNRLLKAINLKGRNLIKRYKTIKLSSQAISFIMNNLDVIHKQNAETVYREFAETLSNLKIKGSIVNLRHTFATNSFYLGKQDIVISREMGHSKMQITKDVYTDVDYHLSAEKINKLYNNLYNLE